MEEITDTGAGIVADGVGEELSAFAVEDAVYLDARLAVKGKLIAKGADTLTGVALREGGSILAGCSAGTRCTEQWLRRTTVDLGTGTGTTAE